MENPQVVYIIGETQAVSEIQAVRLKDHKVIVVKLSELRRMQERQITLFLSLQGASNNQTAGWRTMKITTPLIKLKPPLFHPCSQLGHKAWQLLPFSVRWASLCRTLGNETKSHNLLLGVRVRAYPPTTFKFSTNILQVCYFRDLVRYSLLHLRS